MDTYSSIELGLLIVGCIFALVGKKLIPLPPSDDGGDSNEQKGGEA